THANNTYNDEPAWSTDGRQIVFVTVTFGATVSAGIYVIRSDGRGLRRLTTSFDDSPAWSPDGRRIVFTGEFENRTAIFTMNANGSDQKPVIATSEPTFDPDWQAIGRRLGYRAAPAEAIAAARPRAARARC